MLIYTFYIKILVNIYGILDDCSRYLLFLKCIESKHSQNTAEAAIETILKYGKPYCFWGDNGTENAGVFKKFLIANDIVLKNTLHGLIPVFLAA